jgi:MFS family permease
MAFLKKLGAVMAAAALVILNLVVSGAVIASVHELGYWSYPALFGFNIFLTWLVFMLLPPPNHPEHFLIRRFPKLKKVFTVDAKRFERPRWRWIRSKGAFPLVQAVSLFLGPSYAAATIRLILVFPDRKAWTYGLLTTLISTVLIVSLYIGLLDVVKEHLLSLAQR